MTTPKEINTEPALNISLNTSLIDSLKDTVKANADLAKQQSAITTKATISAVKEAANLPANKDISYQILAEPVSVFNPEAIINAGIAFVNTIGQATIGAISEKLSKVAELSENPQGVEQAQECIDKAGKKCSAIAQNTYKLGQLANGNNITVTFGQKIDTANSYSLSTDSNIDMKAPLFGVNSQDSIWIANNSITQVADFKSGNYKQKLDLVEGAITSQSQTKVSIATSSNESISKNNKIVGTEQITSMGKVNNVIADSSLVAMSGGSTQITSTSNLGIQSNGDVAILATKPEESAEIGASGETDNPTTTNTGGSIIIASKADTDLPASMFAMGKSGIVSSTPKDSFNSAGGYSIMNGGDASLMSSDNLTAVVSKGAALFISNGRSWLGKYTLPITEFGEATLTDLPALPTLPQLPNQQLENCIPKKEKEESGTIFTGEEDPSVFTDESKEGDVFSTNPDITIGLPKETPKPNAKVQLPKESNNVLQGDNTKLPPPSAIANTDSNAKIASWVTPLSVLVEKYIKDKPEAKLTPVYEKETQDTLFNFLENEEILFNVAEGLVSPESVITNDFIVPFLPNSTLPKIKPILQYPEFYLDLLKVDISKIDKFLISIDDFVSADKNKVQAILTIVQEYPELKQSIINIVKQATALPAIGFLGGLSNIIGNVSSFIQDNIKSITDVGKLPKIIESKSYGNLFDLAKPYVTKELNKALNGTPFENLLNNTDLFEFGKAITKGDLTKAARDQLLKDTIDNVYNNTIKQVLEKQALKALGINESILPSIKDILNKVKIGQTIDPTEYINEIANVLIKDNSTLKDIKCGVDSVKYISFRQYLESFGTRVVNIENLTQTILQQEINTASGILSPLLELEAKRILEKESFNILSPIFTSIFNNVKSNNVNDFQAYTNTVASNLNLNTADCKVAAVEIYNNIKGLLNDISKGDVLKIISGANTESLLPLLLGDDNAGKISSIFGLVKDTLGAYESIKLLPELLTLMDEYKVPALDQVSTILNCLDLFNKIKNLLDKSKALNGNNNSLDNFEPLNNKPAVSLLENAGRIIQGANSINSVDDKTLDDWGNNIADEYIDFKDIKTNLNTNLSLDKCFKVPKLNVFQSAIEVLQVKDSTIIFKFTNLEVLQENFNLLPKLNDLIQIRVQGFYSSSTRDYYIPYQTDYEYTPSVYSFVVSNFNIEKNVGLAYYDRAYPSLVLENSEGILYKFTSEAIGVTLNPDIVDSYLLA